MHVFVLEMHVFVVLEMHVFAVLEMHVFVVKIYRHQAKGSY